MLCILSIKSQSKLHKKIYIYITQDSIPEIPIWPIQPDSIDKLLAVLQHAFYIDRQVLYVM